MLSCRILKSGVCCWVWRVGGGDGRRRGCWSVFERLCVRVFRGLGGDGGVVNGVGVVSGGEGGDGGGGGVVQQGPFQFMAFFLWFEDLKDVHLR